jgi:DNA-binding transcriptional LysR family regulator
MGQVADFRDQNLHGVGVIDASEDLARLEYGEAHIALRVGPKPDHPDYVVSSFARVGFRLYAHDRYVQRHGLPSGIDDLAGHKFVVPKEQGRGLLFGPWVTDHIRPEMIAMSSRDVWVINEAMLAGVGMGDYEAQNRGGFHAVLGKKRRGLCPLCF